MAEKVFPSFSKKKPIQIRDKKEKGEGATKEKNETGGKAKEEDSDRGRGRRALQRLGEENNYSQQCERGRLYRGPQSVVVAAEVVVDHRLREEAGALDYKLGRDDKEETHEVAKCVGASVR